MKSKLITCNGQGVCNKDDTCQCNFQSKKLFNITASRFCKSIEQKFFHLKPKYSHRNSIFSNIKFCKVSIQYIVVISKWNIECRLSYYYNYFKKDRNFKSALYFCYQALACSQQSTIITPTDKRTDVWSRDFMIWKINSGLWAVVWAGLWNKRVWADYEQLFRPVF